MAKAKKLPSGRWCCLVYSGIDPLTKKRKYESFTADTRKEAEFLAAEFLISAKEKQDKKNMTVKEGIVRYIESKEAILSPSTINGYTRIAKNNLLSIKNIKYRDIAQEIIQKAINEEAKNHTPKTVRNIHGLLSASLSMFYPEFKVNTTLPKKVKIERHIPTDREIQKLLKYTEGTDIEIPILLSACGSLRRSEIAALTKSDFTDLGVNVNKALVMDSNLNLVIKAPKSSAGYRFPPLPKEVIKKVRELDEGRI